MEILTRMAAHASLYEQTCMSMISLIIKVYTFMYHAYVKLYIIVICY